MSESGLQGENMKMDDGVNGAEGGGHSGHNDDGHSDDSTQRPRTVKRRRIISHDEEDDGGNQDDGSHHHELPSLNPSTASSSTNGTAADTAMDRDAALRKSRGRPTASSRAAAERDKRKVHVEDAKNTPSILSFFAPPKQVGKGKGKEGETAEKKADEGEKGMKNAVNRAEVGEQKDPARCSTAAVAVEEEGKAAAANESKGEPHVRQPTVTKKQEEAQTVSSTGRMQLSTAKRDAKEAMESKSAVRQNGRSAAGEGGTGSKGNARRRKGGPISKMKRKRLQAEGNEDGEEEEEKDKVDAGMQEIADKEEAAIEEEDVGESSSSEDEDHPDLARELAEYNKSATEEKIAQEEDHDKPATAASLTLLGTASYHPIRHASWSAGEAVPYSALCGMFAAVEAETSRLRIIAILSDFLRSVIALTPADLLPTVYLCINAIAPAYEGKETGVGDFILKKVIAATTGMSLARLRESAKDVTDLGVLALSQRKKQVVLFSSAALTVRGVFAVMKEMAGMSGKNVGAKKEGMITKLMVACKGEEAKYLIRSLQGSLRIGLQSKSVIAALARALVITPPPIPSSPSPSSTTKAVLDARTTVSDKKFQSALEEGLATLKQAYTECPNFSLLISAILQYGLPALPTHCSLRAGVPVEVMLGKPASSITAILDKFSDRLFTLEYKYDGERAQVHRCQDGTVRIYSRNSEDNTGKYPDVAGRMKRYEREGVEDYIIDCECVAWDKRERRLLPFQTLTTRKRKDVREEDITVQVSLFAFDLLYLNGQSYLRQTLRQRREALRSHFVPVEGELAFAAHRDTTDVEEIQTFLSQAVTDSCEGLMVKALDDESSAYTPGKRNWLKVKKDYLDGVGDTLDLVPIAAFYGKGKRTGHYGAYVLACYDEESEQYQSITKIGTGFSESDIAHHAAFYNQDDRILPSCPRYYSIGETMRPDVWLAPVQVWEVKCADISISPVHQAAVGRVDASKGLALRFPRFVRVREDKKPEEATSSDQLVELYHSQSVRAGQRKSNAEEDD